MLEKNKGTKDKKHNKRLIMGKAKEKSEKKNRSTKKNWKIWTIQWPKSKLKKDFKKKNRIKGSLRNKLILSYLIVGLVSVLLIAVLTFKKTETIITEKVGNMTDDVNRQTKLNLDTFFSDVNTITSFVFSHNVALYYDASTAVDKADSIQ